MKKILSIVLILAGFVMAQGFGDLISNSDVKHEADDYSATFELLKQAEELEANNFEVIWRLARVHFDFSDNSEDEAVISKNIYSGFDFAERALAMDTTRAESHKWYGILIARVGELEGKKQTILNSYEVKEHTLKAIELDPDDDGNYHVMGRWNYKLADLSWVERKIAGIIYATPPQASFEDARQFFGKAIELEPDDIRNHVWLGKTYEALDDVEAAKNSYNAALAITAENDSDRILQKEAQELLSDL
jgi:tetratricopeptide (TPR) repeat protein